MDYVRRSDSNHSFWCNLFLCLCSAFVRCCNFSNCYWRENWLDVSGRFVKQVQWERWRAKQKSVSRSKHRDRFHGFWGYCPQKNFDNVCAKSYNLMQFCRKMVRIAVHNAFLNTLTMGTATLLEVTPAAWTCGRTCAVGPAEYGVDTKVCRRVPRDRQEAAPAAELSRLQTRRLVDANLPQRWQLWTDDGFQPSRSLSRVFLLLHYTFSARLWQQGRTGSSGGPWPNRQTGPHKQWRNIFNSFLPSPLLRDFVPRSLLTPPSHASYVNGVSRLTYFNIWRGYIPTWTRNQPAHLASAIGSQASQSAHVMWFNIQIGRFL